MINFGLRCGQIMAQRGSLRSMNIVQRTALWYRLERIGEPPMQPEGVVPPPLENPEREWAREQWQYVQQLRAQVNYLNDKVTELRAKRNPRGEY